MYAMNNNNRLPPHPAYVPGGNYWHWALQRDYLGGPDPTQVWVCPAAPYGYWSWPADFGQTPPLPWQYPWGGWVVPPLSCYPAIAKTYAINGYLLNGHIVRHDVNLNDMINPNRTFLHSCCGGYCAQKTELWELGIFFETDRGYAHRTGANFIFLDQHAEFLHDDDIPETWEDPTFWRGTQ